MCYFITIAVPVSHADAIRTRFHEPGLQIEPTCNPAAVAAAGSGFTPLLVTGGGCSCAWYKETPSRATEGRRRKYEKLGWSRAKIERALGSESSRPPPGHGLHAVIITLIRECVTLCGRLAIWVHDFRGRVETEVYQVVDGPECGPDDLAAYAAALKADTKLVIRKQANRVALK